MRAKTSDEPAPTGLAAWEQTVFQQWSGLTEAPLELPLLDFESPTRSVQPPIQALLDPLDDESFAEGGPDATAGTPASRLWLRDGVVMCGCPDCGAPMSIRLWLMLADCWQCGTSIELDEQLVREARRLLDQSRARPATATKPRPQRTASSASASSAPRRPAPSSLSPSRPAAQPPAAGSQRRLSAAESRARAQLRRATRAASVRAWIDALFNDLPAWLVSLVLHMILLALLALLTFGIPEEEEPTILLSTAVRKERQEGGETVQIDPTLDVAFDLPLPERLDLADDRQRQMVLKANQDAKELRLEPGDPEADLPALGDVRQQVGGGHRVGAALVARDPRLRADVVKREGGTTLTEAAVARALRWLSGHQSADGHWSLHQFHQADGCTCNGRGGVTSDAGGTALALLPFLGAGQSHLVGRYQAPVARGLKWLVERQQANGDLRINCQGNTGMYAHGQCAIVLCEAYLMTGDEQLRGPAQRSIDFIVAAQHDQGGWRYMPGQAGDTSVVGWQLMALQSGRAAGLPVPDATLELAGQFLDSVASERGERYAYMPGRGPSPAMTAEALLCRMYLGWTLNDPGLNLGVPRLVREHPPQRQQPNIYYWYYATQTLHHFGGAPWETWNRAMRDILVETQATRGHEAGSWSPAGDHAHEGGRVYMTSLAACCLEVYYRHLPIYRQIDLESVSE